MLEKNSEIIVTIECLGANGEGIAKLDKYIIFIPFALTGEKVKIKVLKVKQNLVFAKVLDIMTPADDRVRPKCKVFTKCGGCQLQHIKYNIQLKLKAKNIVDCFYKIAGINFEVLPPVKSDFIYGYRNKLQLPVGTDSNGDTVVGFFAENSHRIVPIEKCPIHPDWSTDIIDIFKDYIRKYGVTGFNENSGQGLLRHIVVREIGGKFIICIVINGQKIENSDYLISRISEKFKYFNLYININTFDSNVIFGKRFICLYGEKKFDEEEFGISFYAGPETFVQINSEIRRKLYDKVIKLAGVDNSLIIDAYSGGGLLTALLAKNCGMAYGIEIINEAVSCADELAENNGLIGKMINICGKVEEKLKPLLNSLNNPEFTLILDPPRKGCDLTVIKTILELRPKKIIYISCNPSTLARDVGLMTGHLIYEEKNIVKNPEIDSEKTNYNIELIQPYDMFPQTKHVETLICLRAVK